MDTNKKHEFDSAFGTSVSVVETEDDGMANFLSEIDFTQTTEIGLDDYNIKNNTAAALPMEKPDLALKPLLQSTEEEALENESLKSDSEPIDAKTGEQQKTDIVQPSLFEDFTDLSEEIKIEETAEFSYPGEETDVSALATEISSPAAAPGDIAEEPVTDSPAPEMEARDEATVIEIDDEARAALDEKYREAKEKEESDTAKRFAPVKCSTITGGDHLGWYVFPEIGETDVPRDVLIAAGMEESFLPKKDVKAALTKAVKNITAKTKSGVHRRFKTEDGALYTIFVPMLSSDQDDVVFEHNIKFKLDNATGELTFGAGATLDIADELRLEFERQKESIDSHQFRVIVNRYLLTKCHAITTRKIKDSGGPYFVDVKFASELNELIGYFKSFSDRAYLTCYTMYGDESTRQQIKDAIEKELTKQLEDLVVEIGDTFSAGKMSAAILSNRKKEAEKLLKMIELHRHNLQDRASQVKEDVNLLKSALDQVTSVVESKVGTDLDWQVATKELSAKGIGL